jgi:hypothetical protein
VADLTSVKTLFDKTPASAAAETIHRLECCLGALRSHNLSLVDEALQLIWHNPKGLTPQQVFDLLGSKAGPLIQAKDYLWPLIVASTAEGETLPKDHKPEGVTLKINEDGTVTVS